MPLDSPEARSDSHGHSDAWAGIASDIHKRPPSAAEKFASQNGLFLIQRNGHYEFHLSKDGSDKPVLTTEANSQGLEAGQAYLKKLSAQKRQELCKRYGVEISSADDKMLGVDGKPIKLRTPTLGELAAIESSLKRFGNAENVPSVRFNFLAEKLNSQDLPDQPGRKQLFLPPHDGDPAIDMALDKQIKNELLNQKRKEFLIQNDIRVEERAGKFIYESNVTGKEVTLFSTEASPVGIAEAQKQLEAMIVEKELELEQKFKVQIAKPGETTDMKQYLGDTVSPGADFKCALPTWSQLAGLEASLQHSPVKSEGTHQLKFYFLAKRDMDNASTLAYSFPQVNGHEGIVIEPSNGYPGTILDAKSRMQHEKSLEEALTHEMAHYSENTFGSFNRSGNWVDESNARKVSEQLAHSVYGKMGWSLQKHQYGNEVRYEYVLDGNDHFYYSHHGDNAYGRWTRYNAQGQMVDAQGHSVKDLKQAEQLTDTEMRRRSNVPPVSDYFVYPWEMGAEGMQQFRTNAGTRLEMLINTPQMYWLIKEKDQEEIDREYPPTISGRHSRIRDVDGELVEDTDENRRRISSFENRPIAHASK